MHDPSRAFEVALAVLVVSCPCALSLAVPAALAAAHGALSKLGVLALRGEALDTLARADRIVFDKTGTLSDRQPQLVEVDTFDDFPREDALAIAAALERDAGHPFAHAFAAVAEIRSASDVRSEPGHGIAGTVDGRTWRLGRAQWAAQREDDDAIWLGDGSHAVARFLLREAPRADAAQALRELRAQGLRISVCSGDAEGAVARLVDAVGIDGTKDGNVRARQTPEDKLAYVRECQAAGEIVAMVGDGINDAPVLAGADVSLALADGAALAQRAADFVIGGSALRRIPQAIELARRSRRIVRQNLAWAIGYNLLALPLAASGMVTPWLAAIGMALSSLLVTLNALRLTRINLQHDPHTHTLHP